MTDTIDNPAVRLKAARKSSGLAWGAFATAIGISKSSLARYERGEQPVPVTVTLATIGLETVRQDRAQATISA